ncbi:MAG: hypothetical protein ACI9J3_002882 [Parvicellaceae bacterium]|jgi:hypothetical protein
MRQNPPATLYTEYFNGIVVIDSSPIIASFIQPGGTVVKNQFLKTKTGIRLFGAGAGSEKATIRDNFFSENLTAIYLVGGNFADIIDNSILLPNYLGLTAVTHGIAEVYGVKAESSSGFNMEGNVMYNTAAPFGAHRQIGVWAKNASIITGGNIYNNGFEKIETSTQAEDNNSGLQIDCNDFEMSTGTLSHIFHASGTLSDQGQCALTPELPQANIYNGIPCDNVTNFQIYNNPLAVPFQYNSYPDLIVNFDENCVTADLVGLALNCGVATSLTFDDLLTCPSYIFTDDGEPTTGEDYVNALIIQIGAHKIIVDQATLILEEGASNDLLDAIDNLSPGQAKNLLLDHSPYLSDQVLIAALNGGFSPGIIKQILQANSPLSQNVWNEFMASGYNPGITSQIDNMQDGNSAREDKESELNYFKTQKQISLDAAVRYYLGTNEAEKAIGLLENDGSVESICALVPIKIDPDYGGIQTHIDFLRNVADLKAVKDPGDPDIVEIRGFCDFYEVLNVITNRTGSYSNMTSTEKASLELLSDQNIAISAYAKAILSLVNKVEYDSGKALPYLTKDGKMLVPKEDSKIDYEFKVFPNPADNVIFIESEDEIKSYHIFDLTGRLVMSATAVLGNRISLGTENLINGVYVVTVSFENGMAKSQRFVIQNER